MAKKKRKIRKAVKTVAGVAATGYGVRLYATGRKAKTKAQANAFRSDARKVSKVVKKVVGKKPAQGSLFTTNRKGKVKKAWNTPPTRAAKAASSAGRKVATGARFVASDAKSHPKRYAAGAGAVAVTGGAAYAYKRRKRKKAAAKSNTRKGRK